MATLFFAAVIFCFSLSGLANASEVGSFVDIKGRVDLLTTEQLRPIVSKVGDKVSTGDIVRTKSKSEARIVFIDKSSLQIAPSTRFKIEEFDVDSNESKRNVVIRSFRGMLRSVVPKGYNEGGFRYEIKTPTLIAAVRGTEFITVISGPPLSTDVLALSGRVEVWNIDLDIPGITILRPGQMTTVRAGEPPEPARPIPESFDMLISGGGTGGTSTDDEGDAGGAGEEESPAGETAGVSTYTAPAAGIPVDIPITETHPETINSTTPTEIIVNFP